MTTRTLATLPRFSIVRRPARPTIGRAWRTIVTRRDLAEATPRQLRDVGISEADAMREMRRAPWDCEVRRDPLRRPQRRGPKRRWPEAVAFRRWIAAAWPRHGRRQILGDFD